MTAVQAMGFLLGAMVFIKLIADGVMPRLLNQIAGVGGTLSRGSQGIFEGV